MGSRKNWPRELADRCNAVGWEARIVNNGHWRAFLPDGRSFGWAESPSDTNGYKAANREARRMGLDALEEQLKLQREKERLERIERDRELNGVPEHLMKSAKQVPEPKKEDANMTKYGFIEVGGVRLGIAEVHKPVMHQHPRGGAPRPLDFARELLLVDGSIRYQCLKLTYSDPGHPDKVCARHFGTSGGLMVHWARGTHAYTEPKETRDLGASAEPNPSEPRPGPTKEEIIADRTPVAIYTAPDTRGKADDLAVPTGLMAQAVFQVERLRNLEVRMADLTEEAGSIASELERVIEKLPDELVNDELRQKAEKFDAMMKALGQ